MDDEREAVEKAIDNLVRTEQKSVLESMSLTLDDKGIGFVIEPEYYTMEDDFSEDIELIKRIPFDESDLLFGLMHDQDRNSASSRRTGVDPSKLLAYADRFDALAKELRRIAEAWLLEEKELADLDMEDHNP